MHVHFVFFLRFPAADETAEILAEVVIKELLWKSQTLIKFDFSYFFILYTFENLQSRWLEQIGQCIKKYLMRLGLGVRVKRVALEVSGSRLRWRGVT